MPRWMWAVVFPAVLTAAVPGFTEEQKRAETTIPGPPTLPTDLSDGAGWRWYALRNARMASVPAGPLPIHGNGLRPRVRGSEARPNGGSEPGPLIHVPGPLLRRSDQLFLILESELARRQSMPREVASVDAHRPRVHAEPPRICAISPPLNSCFISRSSILMRAMASSPSSV